MALEFHLQIQENSLQAKVLQSLAAERHISPEEVAQQLLEEAISARTQSTPAQQMVGAFSSVEESSMLEEIVAEAYELRSASQPRDFGV